MRIKRYFIQYSDNTLQLQAGKQYSIGRAKHSDILLTDMSVSREHALLKWETEGFVIEDCKSTNGVFLNSRKILKQPLTDNDKIEVGHILLKYKELENSVRQQAEPALCDTMLLEAEVAAITKELDNPDLSAKIRQLKRYIHRKRAELSTMAYRDELTRLYNRRYFQEKIQEEFARVRRSKRELTVIMVDIDHFKKVNDTYGHQKGDQVLHTVGKILRSLLRESDIPARYGGDELVIVLPETDLHSGQLLAEKIRQAVQRHFSKLFRIEITLSLGIASYRPQYTSPASILKAADAALYCAKAGGRNRAEVEK